jgi:hypothetical protein
MFFPENTDVFGYVFLALNRASRGPRYVQFNPLRENTCARAPSQVLRSEEDYKYLEHRTIGPMPKALILSSWHVQKKALGWRWQAAL